MFFLFPLLVFGQKEGNHMIFGSGIWLDFNHEPVEFKILNFGYSVWEGGITISDEDGNLILFSNGHDLYGRQHIALTRNLRLLFNKQVSSTTSTQMQVVKKPKSQYTYYIFQPGWQGRPLMYVELDLRRQDKIGAVVSIPYILYENTTEKITVIKHENNEALWVITHEFESNRFLVYKIDENGVDHEPVISSVGHVHADVNGRGSNAIGYMTSSIDGKKVALAVWTEGVVEVFDFDVATGKLSNPQKYFHRPEEGAYGIEFSPDGSKLYFTTEETKFLYQLDFSSGDPEKIQKSLMVLEDSTACALQIAPDGKIYYISFAGYPYIGTISKPNSKGFECEPNRRGIYTSFDATPSYGMPDMTHHIIYPEIMHDGFCEKSPTTFWLYDSTNVKEIIWDFGDTLPGIENYSDSFVADHTYFQGGDYLVTAFLTYDNNVRDTISLLVNIGTLPPIDLGNDTLLCEGQTMTIQLWDSLISYYWMDGLGIHYERIDRRGKYWGTAYDDLCWNSDTLSVEYLAKPELALNDTSLCQDQDMLVRLPAEENTKYTWNDGVGWHERLISKPGNFSVTASNKCGITRKYFSVSYIDPLRVDLGEDLILCKDQQVTLNVGQPNSTYLWHDGHEGEKYTFNSSGTYWVNVTNRCETVSDTILVSEIYPNDLFIPNIITPNGDNINDNFVIPSPMAGSEIHIYNRWGKEVYMNPSYQNNWPLDDIQSGTYFYSIFEPCTQEFLDGWIRVLK